MSIASRGPTAALVVALVVLSVMGTAPLGGAAADAGGAATAPPLFDWLSPAVVARLEASERVPLSELSHFPVGSDDPTGDLPLPYTRIRPGSPLGVTQLACTANFVFRDGDRIGIGTAGHCTAMGAEHAVLLVDAVGMTIGLHAFGSTVMRASGGVGTDFALIEVYPEYRDLVHPAIAQIDGPCGWRGPSVGEAIQFHGHGLGFGAGGQTRTGIVIAASNPDSIQYVRAPGGAGGDSGSPIRFLLAGGGADLAAAGLNTHGLLQLGSGTSMPRVHQLLAQQGFDAWTLVDSPTCELLGL